MFLSTVIPSFRFNVNNNLGATPYNFSLPYNFSRGKNIILSITPSNIGSASNNTADYNKGFYDCLTLGLDATNKITNAYYIQIPENVTTYTKSISFSMYYYLNTTSDRTRYTYTISVLFDITNNIITFTPTGISPTNNTVDRSITSPVLLTISTIL